MSVCAFLGFFLFSQFFLAEPGRGEAHETANLRFCCGLGGRRRALPHAWDP